MVFMKSIFICLLNKSSKHFQEQKKVLRLYELTIAVEKFDVITI